ncbi:signal peptidase I [Polyangium jinanense]|uniref:signal peptidase I n=1 Tax=Polyangium jinanense TaxID=2829994 RepID=UPI002340D61E|nr:signal peptidase I [Polyangium jinanense]MDC3955312.1 signal peptidase I [Polyangium jinanense]
MATVTAVMLLARTSLADHYVVPSGSMEPTVHVGDRILVDKRAFGVRLPVVDTYVLPTSEPQPGDVVVLASPENDSTLLKRVVAGPGDMVTVKDGRITLNGQEASVTHEPSGDYEELGDTRHPLRLGFGKPDFGPARVPDGHYLVMGDNRGNSHDGRLFGFVARDAIRGRAVRVFLRNGDFTWKSL